MFGGFPGMMFRSPYTTWWEPSAVTFLCGSGPCLSKHLDWHTSVMAVLSRS